MLPHERMRLSANVSVVLHHTLYAANVGAAARAMKNCGFTNLRLVRPPRDRYEDAPRLAHAAADIVAAAESHSTLGDALADVQFVVGTSSKTGGWRRRVLEPEACMRELVPLLEHNRVALLFGPEDRGLENEDVARCTHFVCIPTAELLDSINLAQSVMILCHELFKALSALPVAERPAPPRADRGAMEALFGDIRRTLEFVGYYHTGDADYWMLAVRAMIDRAGGLDPKEINLLRGVLKQMRFVASVGVERRLATLLRDMHLAPPAELAPLSAKPLKSWPREPLTAPAPDEPDPSGHVIG